MSKSKKWKVEWSFFLGTDGRRKYNEVCRRCIHDCKQSLRTMILACVSSQVKYTFFRQKVHTFEEGISPQECQFSQ